MFFKLLLHAIPHVDDALLPLEMRLNFFVLSCLHLHFVEEHAVIGFVLVSHVLHCPQLIPQNVVSVDVVLKLVRQFVVLGVEVGLSDLKLVDFLFDLLDLLSKILLPLGLRVVEFLHFAVGDVELALLLLQIVLFPFKFCQFDF